MQLAPNMKTKIHLLLGETVALASVAAIQVNAQTETTGTPGSPSATITIVGKQLPRRDAKFRGVIRDGTQKRPTLLCPI